MRTYMIDTVSPESFYIVINTLVVFKCEEGYYEILRLKLGESKRYIEIMWSKVAMLLLIINCKKISYYS